MSDDVLEVADKLWRGELSVTSLHPVGFQGALAEVRPGVAFIPSFANVSAFSTADGLVFVDTGSSFVAKSIHEEIRKWSDSRLDTAIYSHGHIDHVFGVPVFEVEAAERGWKPPVVVAHEALPPRFDRYIRTAGYNAVINRRQFQVPGLQWPVDYRYPDRTYSDRLNLEIGGVSFALHHAKGETDDHTWTWVEEHKTLCCGDLFIWASPNAGNPQKVQRFPGEWAAALREMIELGPEILLPGHGFPVIGADRVRQALTDTAELLESLLEQTLALMNEGARLSEILHTVEAPRHLLERPYLRPVYDEPEFVVRNIWRLYGGWYDGDPSSLKPSHQRDLAIELASLAGGAGALADRAMALAEAAKAAHEAVAGVASGAAAGAVAGAAAGAAAGVVAGAAARAAAGAAAGVVAEAAAGVVATATPRPASEPFPQELRMAGHLAEMAMLADPADPGIRRIHSEVFALMAAAASSTMAKGIYSWAATGSDYPE